MPNWCFSSVSITDSKEKLDVIEKEMNNALSANPIGADFGNMWLGNLLLHIGFDKDTVVYGNIRCRGSVVYLDRTKDDELIVDTETAWCPHVTCIKMFARHYSDTAKITYMAEEPGCELFWTNDPETAKKYVVDECIDDKENFPEKLEGLITECNLQELDAKALRSVLINAYGPDDLPSLIGQAMSEDIGDRNFLSIHAYEYVPIGSDT